MKEFKYHRVLYMSDGKVEYERDRCNVVPDGRGKESTGPEGKAFELWEVTGRMSFRIRDELPSLPSLMNKTQSSG